MAEIKLRIDDLVLDGDNPRITHAESQHQALQKVVRDQRLKLVRLAEHIVENGLSPIERLMVMEVSQRPKRFVALEGNRRVTALKLLANPAVMTGLEMPNGMQRSIEKLAAIFDRTKVEPIFAHEVKSREEGRPWIAMRHNGEDEGRGVVAWKPVVAARFRKKEPAIQVLDIVLEHGGLDEPEADRIRTSFSLTTLRRLLESKDVRTAVGLTVQDGQLCTELPGSEIIKPLRKMVRDIADKTVDSRRFNKTERMLEYVNAFDKASRPDTLHKGALRLIEGIPKLDFAKAKVRTEAKKRRKPDERHNVVPKGCALNVTDNRIAEIYRELQKLKLVETRNAIAVLMRAFLEMSVDHYLEKNGHDLQRKDQKSGKSHWKTLDAKLDEVVDSLVNKGAAKSHFAQVKRSISVTTSPLHTGLLHDYVHNRYATPSLQELTAAWNNAQPLFEHIWP
jgi:hypothetical protein